MSGMTKTITVTGAGSADAVPDLLTISIGVECRQEDVGAAYSGAGKAAAAISSALRQYGVENADISTSGLNVRAELVWQEGQGQKVAAYVASSVLNVRVRNVAGSSEIIAAAVHAGGNDVRLNGLELGFVDAAAVSAQARAAAWQDARTTAQQFASLSGAELGEVLSVMENSAVGGPIPVTRIQRALAVEAISVEAGEASVSASVTVVWELRS